MSQVVSQKSEVRSRMSDFDNFETRTERSELSEAKPEPSEAISAQLNQLKDKRQK